MFPANGIGTDQVKELATSKFRLSCFLSQASPVPSVGEISVNGNAAGERDGIYAGDEESLEIVLKTDGEIVLADLPLI